MKSLSKAQSVMKRQLVLIRHGQSEWNRKNLFTGWTDVDLSAKGREEALQAGVELKKRNCFFDCAFSSALKRAIQTLEIVLDKMGCNKIPVEKAWWLNERHYGALQGQNRDEVIKKYGRDQVHKWRRDFSTTPPLTTEQPVLDRTDLYRGLHYIPGGESLKDTQQRVLSFWKSRIFPCVQKGKSVLIVAHGNSLRVLIKYLENVSDDQISFVEIKTGTPLIYEIDTAARILSKESLEF